VCCGGETRWVQVLQRKSHLPLPHRLLPHQNQRYLSFLVRTDTILQTCAFDISLLDEGQVDNKWQARKAAKLKTLKEIEQEREDSLPPLRKPVGWRRPHPIKPVHPSSLAAFYIVIAPAGTAPPPHADPVSPFCLRFLPPAIPPEIQSLF
jgi:hypothetical protein